MCTVTRGGDGGIGWGTRIGYKIYNCLDNHDRWLYKIRSNNVIRVTIVCRLHLLQGWVKESEEIKHWLCDLSRTMFNRSLHFKDLTSNDLRVGFDNKTQNTHLSIEKEMKNFAYSRENSLPRRWWWERLIKQGGTVRITPTHTPFHVRKRKFAYIRSPFSSISSTIFTRGKQKTLLSAIDR